MKTIHFSLLLVAGLTIGILYGGLNSSLAETNINQQQQNCIYDVMVESGLEVPMRLAELYCECVIQELLKLNQPLNWETQRRDKALVIPIKNKCKF